MHILETPRLILRPPSHSDELLLHELHSDPFVVNAMRNGVYPTIEQSKAALLQFINHWQHNRFGLWMVFVKAEGQARKFAGCCGLMCIGTYLAEDPNYLPEDPNNVEIVTCLHLATSGKGIAVEAGRAVVQFAFEHLKLEKVNAFVRQNNTRSLIKNLKIGFFYVGDVISKNGTRRRRLEVSPITATKADNLLVFGYTDPETIRNQ
ncbi:GNAT family N-acetyltransferase [Mesorhizobium sp. M0510]|uniref:GNAT family N-acetyltransferase n=1 Tax=Mesorhizobium sp. M0510 TaxID=2956954 RepID=UPI0033369F82